MWRPLYLPTVLGCPCAGPSRAKVTAYGLLTDEVVSESSPSQQGVPFRLRVGVDVLSVADVAASLDRFGERYVRRAFTEHEASYCRAGAGATAAARFAVRFAAKEATLKALRPDAPWGDWRAIEVRRHRSGRCAIALHGAAASLAVRRGVNHLALSMSHDGDLAAAVVVAVTAAAGDQER